MIKCDKCHIEKIEEEFNIDNNHKTGRQRYCRSCSSDKFKENMSEYDLPYIYFFYGDDELIYIGSTGNAYDRIREHEKLIEYPEVNQVRLLRVYRGIETKELEFIEWELIMLFNPRGNRSKHDINGLTLEETMELRKYVNYILDGGYINGAIPITFNGNRKFLKKCLRWVSSIEKSVYDHYNELERNKIIQ